MVSVPVPETPKAYETYLTVRSGRQPVPYAFSALERAFPPAT
jgi:hypothetical protein